ncbi:MAG: copper resistance CopC family protein [Ahrensia sp.]
MTQFIRTFIGALMAFGLAAQAALAHSSKQGTQPSDGEVLTTSPQKVGMTFDMPMRVTLVSLTDQDGKDHALTRQDNMQPIKVFDATPPILPVGSYTVEWRGLAEDGHPMQGTFSFQVTE